MSCFLGLTAGLSAQSSPLLLQGIVVEAQSEEPLAGATIWDMGRGVGTTTNSRGYFSMSLPSACSMELRVSFLGSQGQAISFPMSKDTMLRIELSLEVNIGEVVVSERLVRMRDPEMGVMEIAPANIRATPMLLGTANLQKVLQGLPGVQGATETSSEMLVRGGNGDENLVLLDDIPLYHSSHLGGFFSVFNEEAISSARLTKGDFKARTGGRVSSLLDVRMKQGGLDKHSGVFGLGLLSAQATLDGPGLAQGHSYMVSARKSLADLAQKGYQRWADRPTFGTGFHDIYMKYGMALADGLRLDWSVYQGLDAITEQTLPRQAAGLSSKGRTYWTNQGAAVRLSGIWGRTYFQSPVSFTQFRMGTRDQWSDPDQAESLSEFVSQVRELRWASLFERSLAEGLELNYGHESSLFGFVPYDYRFENANLRIRQTRDQAPALSVAAFAELSLRWESRWSARVGTRWTAFGHGTYRWAAPEPRVGLSWQARPQLSVKLSYARNHQMLHQLGGADASPLKAWVPATHVAPVRGADQVAIGVMGYWESWGLDWQFESFYKKTENIARLESAQSFFAGIDWEKRILAQGSGQAYGLEFLLRKEHGAFTGWLGLAYTQAWRSFPGFDAGRAFPHAFARPWDIDLNLSHGGGGRWSFSLSWVLRSGEAITLPAATFPVSPLGHPATTAHYYEAYNRQRLPAYHRLDVGATFRNTKKRGLAEWNFSIFNAYNRQNASYYFLKETPEGTRLMGQTSFPFLPSLSYGFRF